MAASITASPNPVLISAWRLSPMKSTITWDTGSSVAGKVYLSIDGAAEVVFDGDPAGKRNGSKSQAIELGKTYDFRLKQATLLGTVLATLRIKGEEKLGFTSGIKQLLENLMPASQYLFDVRVDPGIDSVRIRFRTRQAANCFIEIKNEKTDAVVAVALLEKQNTYDVLLAKGIQFTPDYLEQDTTHSFRIVAPALPGSLIPGDKTETGQFRTGGRTAQFFFDRILVHDDGDPGFLLGDGDFDFFFGAGDADTAERLGNEEEYRRVNIGSGEFRNISSVVTIPQAPPSLWAQVHAYEDDSLFTAFRAAVETSFRPQGTTCIPRESGPETSVTQHFDFSDLTDAIVESPFELSNGPCSCTFTVNCRVRVEAHPGALLAPAMKKSGRAPLSPLPRAAILQGPGDRAIVGAGTGRGHRVRLSSGGAVFVRMPSRNPEKPADRWTRVSGEVAGPLTIVASGPDSVSLFALKPDGAVAHKSLSRDVPAIDEWETLGGNFVGSIAAAVGPDGRIEIFGLDRDGGVFHRALGAAGAGRESGKWQQVGDGVRGSLTAVSSPRGVGVIAQNRGGEILHKFRRDDEWRPAAREWQSLGAAPAGAFSAELIEEDIVVLAVLADDESISLRPWRNYPEAAPADDWKSVGTINSLLDARLSLIEPGRTAEPSRKPEQARS